MIRRPPRSTRTDTLFPYTTLFRSSHEPGIPAFSIFIPEDFQIRQKQTWRRLTPKFVLQYEPSSNLLAYARYARGFKSGGFNGQASAPDETVGFAPEIAEIGRASCRERVCQSV